MKYRFLILFFSFFFFLFYFFFNNIFKEFKDNSKNLKILTWSNTFDLETIKKFEKETGIKAIITYYGTNEELIAKLTIDNSTFDIVMPSDYAIKVLVKKNLIKELNKNKLIHLKDLKKEFLDVAYYQDAFVCMPFEWIIYGLALKKDILKLFQSDDDVYNAFFNGYKDEKKLRISSTNDFLTAFNAALNHYKHNFPNNKIERQEDLYNIIFEILLKQREYTSIYSDERLNFLFESNIIDMAYMPSDQFMIAKKKTPDLMFIIPSYGFIKSIECLAIPKDSKNEELAYEFINFITNKEVSKNIINVLNVFPANLKYLDEMNKNEMNILEKFIYKLVNSNFKEHFINELFDAEKSIKLWIALKSR